MSGPNISIRVHDKVQVIHKSQKGGSGGRDKKGESDLVRSKKQVLQWIPIKLRRYVHYPVATT